MIYIEKKNINFKILMILVFLLMNTLSKADVNKSGNGILENYIKSVFENNASLKDVYHKWQSTLSGVEVASTLPDPQFNAGYFLQSIETKVGPQKFKIGVSQKIPFEGKLSLKEDVVRENANAILEEYNQLKLNLENTFKKNYYNLSYLKQQQIIYSDHLSLLKDFALTLKSSYEASKASYNSLIRVDIEIDKLSDRLSTLKEMESPIIATLNSILNRPALGKIHIEKLNKFAVNVFSDEDEVKFIKNLYQSNPQLRSFSHKIKSKTFKKKLAAKNYFPDFTVGVDWINTGSSNVPGIDGSGKDALIIKAGINIPIWRNKYKAIEIGANEDYLSTVEMQVNLKNNYEAKLKKAFFDYKDGLRKQKLYKEMIIPKAEESLRVMLSSFETEESNYIDIIDGERVLLEFQLNYEKAVTDTLSAVSEIKSLVGNNEYKNENINKEIGEIK